MAEAAPAFLTPASKARLSQGPGGVAAALLVAGTVLRTWQDPSNSSLWIDEAALARNILDRSLAGLVGGLDYAQIAPLGFLAIEKAAVTLFGPSEFALRAFPFLCGILSQFLFLAIARRILSDWAATFAAGLFCLGVPFIYFSSQVKQYSSDVAAALVMLLAVIEVRRRGTPPRLAWLLGALGAGVVWISQPALFVLAGLGAALVIVEYGNANRQSARALWTIGVLWGASGAAAALLAFRSVTSADRAYFRWFWSEGFMPMPPGNASDLLWVFKKLIWAFGAFGSGIDRLTGGMNYRWSWVFTLVMTAGLVSLWRSRRDVALFLGLPVVIVAGLSAGQLYPFTARLFLFLLPSLLLATAAGAQYLLSIWPPRGNVLMPVGLAILGGAPLYAVATALPPFRLQHSRPVIQHVAAHRDPGDRVYVYYGAGQAFHYYAQLDDVSMDDVVVGRCAAGTPRLFLEDLDQFRGAARVWVIVTHSLRDGLEERLILDYLDRIGRRLDSVIVPGTGGHPIEAASAYLYDLSDPIRLAAASSDRFEISGLLTRPASKYECYGVGLSESGHPR